MKLNIFKKFIFAGLSICAILCVSNVSAMKRSATWTMEDDFDNNTGIDDIFALESDGQNNNDGNDDAPLTLDIPSTPNNLNTATTTNNNNYSTDNESHNFVNNETSSNVPKPTQHDTQQQDFDDIFTEGNLDDILDLVGAPAVAQPTAVPAASSATLSNTTHNTISQRPVQKPQAHSPLYLELNEQYNSAQTDINNAQYSQAQKKLLDLINKIKTSKQLNKNEMDSIKKITYRALGRIFELEHPTSEFDTISENDITKKLTEGKRALKKEKNYEKAKKIFLSVLKITNKKQYLYYEKYSALFHLGRTIEILSNSSTTNNNSTSSSQLATGQASSLATPSNTTQGTISQQPVQEPKANSPLYLKLKNQYNSAQTDITNKQYLQARQKLLDIFKKIKKNKQLKKSEKEKLKKITYRALGRIFESTNQNAKVYSISENDITQKLTEGRQAIDVDNYEEAKKIFLSVLKITNKKQYLYYEKYSALFHLGQITEILSNSSTTNNNSTSSSQSATVQASSLVTPSNTTQGTIVREFQARSPLYLELNKQHKLAQTGIKEKRSSAKPNYLNYQKELFDILKRSKPLKCASTLKNQTYCNIGEIFAKLKSIPQSSEFKSFEWLGKQIAAGINAMLKNNFLEAQNIFLDVLKYCNNNANENIKISAYYFLGRITEILSDSATTNNNFTSTSSSQSAIGQASSLATPSNTTDSCLSIDLIKQLNDAQLFFK